MQNKLNIVLVLRSGGRYGLADVELLSYHLHKWKGDLDIDITCLWDGTKHMLKEHRVTFIPMKHHYRHWFSKMNIFDPCFRGTINGTFLYMDLDTVVIGNYAAIIPENQNQFIMLRDFFRTRLAASGVLWMPNIYNAESQCKLDYLWNVWKFNPERNIKKYRGDGEFIRAQLTCDSYWQDNTKLITTMKPGKIVRHIKPEGVAFVCFHGRPSIFEASKNIEWIADYVNEYEK